MNPPASRRGRVAEVLAHNALVLFALTGLAVAQPLLDLFGRNPEFFLAQDAGRADIVWFGIAVTLLLPAVLITLEVLVHLASWGAGRVLHSLIVGLLSAALALTLLRHADVGVTVVAVGLSLLVGVGVAVAERRSSGLRFGLRVLAFAPLVFLGAFLLVSSTSRLIWEDEAEAEQDVTIGRQAPVVEVVFDEFPLASILGADGSINAERFPNFARLSEASSWYRNAGAVSWQTEHSVPSILTGRTPSTNEIPSSIDHPRNLFTLLGGSYEMHVEEQITDLCPDSVCDVAPEPTTTSTTAVADGLTEPAPTEISDLLVDAAVVYGHAALPPDLRTHLPSIGHSWGDFLGGGGDAEPTASTAVPDAAVVVPEGEGSASPFANFARWQARGIDGQSPPAQGAIVEDLIDSAATPGRARLSFAHVVLPHFPWQMTPLGRRYSSRADLPSFTERTVWPEDEFAVRQAHQQHLLQVGYADTLIGELIDRMQAAGTWDEALVVIVADHGVSFRPGGPQRAPTDDNVDEIYRVPLFVKAPGQTEGETRDDTVQLVDVLPTTVDALDLEVDWTFDGRSLLSDEPAPVTREIVTEVGPSTLPTDTAGLLRAVATNEERFGLDPAWRGVFAIGELGEEVGRSLDDLDVRGSTRLRWSLDQRDALRDVELESGFVPILVSGTIDSPGGEPVPDEFLVAVNGTVAGVAGGLDRSGDRVTFSALLAESTLQDGANTVALLAPRGSGGDRGWVRVPEREPVRYELADEVLQGAGGEIEVTGPTDDLSLTVESAFQDDQALAVKGWAIDGVDTRPADSVLVFVDGAQVAVASSRDRPDLEDALGADLPRVGFEVVVPNRSVPPGAAVTVVALFGDRAVGLPVVVEGG